MAVVATGVAASRMTSYIAAAAAAAATVELLGAAVGSLAHAAEDASTRCRRLRVFHQLFCSLAGRSLSLLLVLLGCHAAAIRRRHADTDNRQQIAVDGASVTYRRDRDTAVGCVRII